MMQDPPVHGKTVELPYALKVFLLLSAGLTILSIVYTIVCRRLKLGLPYSFPYYYVPGTMFGDFFDFHDKFRQWGTPAFFEHTQYGYFMYPAPLLFVFRFFFALPHPRTCFILAMVLTSAGLASAFIRILRRQGLSAFDSVLFVGSTLVLSYPFAYLLQRANIEFVIWLVSAIGIWCFFTGRTNTAAFLIGLAASFKLYPFIFLGLFLPRRKYGALLLGIATVVCVTLLSLHAIGPNIAAAAHWNSAQIAAFSQYYVGDTWALGYDHSLFALLKVFTLHLHPNYSAWARPYSIAIALISVALYFLHIWRLPLANQVLALSVLSVTLAPVSYDYTLLNLYPAFAILAMLSLQAQRQATLLPHLTAYMVLFALIFTPESYIIFRGVRYGAQVRTISLIIMLFHALRTPLANVERPNPGRLQSA